MQMRLVVFLIVILISNVVAGQGGLKLLPVQGSPNPLPPGPVRVQLAEDTFTFQSPGLAPQTSIVSYGWTPQMNSPLIDFLASQQIQSQIEFSPEQQAQFKDFQKKLQSEYAAIRKEFPGLEKKETSAADRRKMNRSVYLKFQEVKKEMSKELEESLVPQQLSIVKQLKFKQSVQSFGFTWALTNSPFKEDVDLSTKQQQEIQKIKRETEAAIQKKMIEMRAEAKKKMLKLLDQKQVKKIKELEGENDKNSNRFFRL